MEKSLNIVDLISPVAGIIENFNFENLKFMTFHAVAATFYA
jgi:hypothetical protein